MHARTSVAAREEKKETLFCRASPVSRLQSRAWSFACLRRFVRRTKNKERLLIVYTEAHRFTIPVGDLDVFFVPCSLHVDHIISYFFTGLKLYHHSLCNTHMTISTLLILAVRRAHVIHEPCIWPSLPRVLRRSVVRASDRCTEGHWINSFLCPVFVTC